MQIEYPICPKCNVKTINRGIRNGNLEGVCPNCNKIISQPRDLKKAKEDIHKRLLELNLFDNNCNLVVNEKVQNKHIMLETVPEEKKKALIISENLEDETLTDGEYYSILFFKKKGITYKRDYELGKKKIDFCLSIENNQILWENADKQETYLDIDIISRKFFAFNYDPLKKVKSIVSDKSKQLKEAKGKYPVILVVLNKSILPDDDPHSFENFILPQIFTKDRNTKFSAIAFLTSRENNELEPYIDIYPNKYSELPLPKNIINILSD